MVSILIRYWVVPQRMNTIIQLMFHPLLRWYMGSSIIFWHAHFLLQPTSKSGGRLIEVVHIPTVGQPYRAFIDSFHAGFSPCIWPCAAMSLVWDNTMTTNVRGTSMVSVAEAFIKSHFWERAEKKPEERGKISFEEKISRKTVRIERGNLPFFNVSN